MTRRVVATLPSLVRMGGALRRMVGSTDAVGQGTAFPLASLGPYVLAEDARGIGGPGLPPFGPHPHAGLLVVSWFAEGGAWRSTSNVPGAERLDLVAGQVLLTCAGRGVRHEEITATAGEHEILQVILRLPEPSRQQPAWLRVLQPVLEAPGVLRLYDAAGLAPSGLRASAWHCRLTPGATARLALESDHDVGLVYLRGGAATVGGRHLEAGVVALLEEQGDALVLQASAEEGADLVVLAGASLPGRWEKLLGHEGFLVGPDLEWLQARMAVYAADPTGFGQGEA